ncbi:hypothetical protein ASE36_21230 [Rhizobium sp. Root274]|nr:hypothetical protein ASE36_21230 [Rhizobium sp. Root274]
MEIGHDKTDAPGEMAACEIVVKRCPRITPTRDKYVRIIEPSLQVQVGRDRMILAHGDHIVLDEQFFTMKFVLRRWKHRDGEIS